MSTRLVELSANCFVRLPKEPTKNIEEKLRESLNDPYNPIYNIITAAVVRQKSLEREEEDPRETIQNDQARDLQESFAEFMEESRTNSYDPSYSER